MINWRVPKKEARIIDKIASRAVAMALANDIEYSFQDADMDITAVHANGCRLNLSELLHTDEANFGHDIFGIRRFLNRETGELRGFFTPRHSEKEAA
jgi:hypothetical protein